MNAPENRAWDEAMDLFSHNLVQWDQPPTCDGEHVTFSGTLLGGAVLSSGDIELARKDGYQNFHLLTIEGWEFTGNICPPFDDTLCMSPRHPGDTNALDYQLEGRTFTVNFRFPQDLGDPFDYFVDVWGFRDERRIPELSEDRDRLGYARIREE